MYNIFTAKKFATLLSMSSFSPPFGFGNGISGGTSLSGVGISPIASSRGRKTIVQAYFANFSIKT